jgi:hypothetical protein
MTAPMISINNVSKRDIIVTKSLTMLQLGYKVKDISILTIKSGHSGSSWGARVYSVLEEREGKERVNGLAQNAVFIDYTVCIGFYEKNTQNYVFILIL